MAEYAELVNALRCCAKQNSLSLYKRDLMKQAAETIERLSAEMCPYYIRNIHDRGDDSLCQKFGCEVKDVQPVVHGKWRDYKDYPTYDDYYQCSICGVLSKGKFYFCSNCGADMRGESDG